MHVQGNIFPMLCILCSPLSFLSLFLNHELIILLKAISAVFEYLDLSKPTKSSGIKLWEASLSLFPLLSRGSTLVMIIGSPFFSLAGILKDDNASRFELTLTSFATCVS